MKLEEEASSPLAGFCFAEKMSKMFVLGDACPGR